MNIIIGYHFNIKLSVKNIPPILIELSEKLYISTQSLSSPKLSIYPFELDDNISLIIN